MTHGVYADAGDAAPITGETAKRYLFSAPKERDIAPGFSYIYVIQSGERGPVKIGHGASPLWRMCQLQIGSWEELYLGVYPLAIRNRMWHIMGYDEAPHYRPILPPVS